MLERRMTAAQAGRSFWVCALFVLIAAGSPVAAQDAGATASSSLAEPQSTTAEFGDWTTRCRRSNNAGLACEAAQFIHMPDQRQPVAQLIISRPKNGWHIAIEVAPDVTLGDPLTVSLGPPDRSVRLDWSRCLPIACVAESVLTAPEVDGWMTAATAGTFQFKDSHGAGISFPMSPRGLREALAAFPSP